MEIQLNMFICQVVAIKIHASPPSTKLELLGTTAGELVAQLKDMFPDEVHNIAFGPDSKQLAVTCESELAIRVFNTSKFVANK